jgi:hypothetical protein
MYENGGGGGPLPHIPVLRGTGPSLANGIEHFVTSVKSIESTRSLLDELTKTSESK